MAMTRETKIGLLVGLAFIILFGIILSEKGTGRGDQLATPSMSAYKPVVELIPPTTPPTAQLTRTGKSDAADRLTLSETGAKATEQTPPGASVNNLNNIARPVETISPPVLNPQPTPVVEIAPKLKPLLPPASTKGLSKIPAASPTVTDIMGLPAQSPAPAALAKADEPMVTEKEAVAALKTHTVQQGETLASICRQYYPGQAYQMLKEVMELNKISKPEKLMQGQTIKLPGTKPTAVAAVKPADPETSTFASSKLLVPVETSGSAAESTPDQDLKELLTQSDKPAPKAKIPAAAPETKVAKAAKTSGKTYVVQSNDSLKKIARRLYGSEKAWTRIYELNKKAISDPKNLKKGLKLNIPASVKGSTSTSELAAGPKVE
jgi:nucleoid-associated protein YgaU